MIHIFSSGGGKKNSPYSAFASYCVRKSYSELNFLLKRARVYMSISPGVMFMGAGGGPNINMFSIKVEMYVHFMVKNTHYSKKKLIKRCPELNLLAFCDSGQNRFLSDKWHFLSIIDKIDLIT